MALLNFGKRYKDDLRVIFDQWQKLHLGLDALSNQKILKGIYYLYLHYKKVNKQNILGKQIEKHNWGIRAPGVLPI